jgi:Uma2 family endonuclease
MTLLTEPAPPTLAEPAFDWLNPPDGKLYELIDGVPVEKRVSFYSVWIASQIVTLLKLFAEPKGLGYVAAEVPVLGIFGRPNRHRRPDVVYVSRATLPEMPLKGDLTNVVPDLIAEVVSPHDAAEEVETKILQYLMAGVKVIWVVYPETKVVRVHHADGAMLLLNLAGTLDGAAALPGFTCQVVDIFPKA